MREARFTASPKMSFSSITTGPKWKPTWIARLKPPSEIDALATCSCMSRAAPAAWSALGKRHMTSSPMVLISAPPYFSVLAVISWMQRETSWRAFASPRAS